MKIKSNVQANYITQLAGMLTDSGVANAYAVTLDPAITSYTAGLTIVFQATNANTGASTINVNGVGVKQIKKNVATALASGDILANQVVTLVYDGSNFQYMNLTQPASIVTSVGLSATGSALTVSGSPVTSSGTLALTWAGASTQYVGGDGSLITFPTNLVHTTGDEIIGGQKVMTAKFGVLNGSSQGYFVVDYLTNSIDIGVHGSNANIWMDTSSNYYIGYTAYGKHEFIGGSLKLSNTVNTYSTGGYDILVKNQTTSLLEKIASGTFTSSITLTGEVTGSGTSSIATTIDKTITPIWSGLHKFTGDALGLTQSDVKGIQLINQTASVSSGATQQISPAIKWTSTSWDFGAGSSKLGEFRAYVISGGGSNATWKLQASINGGTWTDYLTVPTNGQMTAPNGADFGTGGVNMGYLRILATTSSAFKIDSTGAAYLGLSTALNGSTNTHAIIANGQANAGLVMSAGYAFAAALLNGGSAVEASSGTHPLIAAVAIKPVNLVDGTATTSNAATLYVEGATSGTATVTNNYAVWVDNGTTRLDGSLLLTNLTSTTTSNVLYYDSTTGTVTYGAAPTGGGGTGTINSGSSGQIAYYSSTGTILSGSALYHTSGNLGIGNASPGSKGYLFSANIGATGNEFDAFMFENNSTADATTQQASPSLIFSGRGWKTDATAASQTVRLMQDVLPVISTSRPEAEWRLRDAENGGSYNYTLSARRGVDGYVYLGMGTSTTSSFTGIKASSSALTLSVNGTAGFTYTGSALNVTLPSATTANTLYYNTSTGAITYGAAAGGGSGTVNSGTANMLAYYSSTGAAVSGTGFNLTWDGTTFTASNVTVSSALTLSSLSNTTTSNVLYYNSTTGAVTYGAAPSGSGSGTVNSGTTNWLAYYSSSGTAVSGSGANLTWDGTTLSASNVTVATALTLSALTSATTSNVLYYNSSTGAVTYGAAPSGGSGTVTSVGLSVTASTALSVSGSPVTTSGTLALTWTGGPNQYVLANGTLAAKITAVSQLTNDSNYMSSVSLLGDLSGSGGPGVTATVLKASTTWALTGVITPAQITANQSNYNPTGFSTASVVRLSSDQDGRVIQTLSGGSNGRIVTLQNVGSFTILIDNEGTAGGGEFQLETSSSYFALRPNSTVQIIYDSTTSRWRIIKAMDLRRLPITLGAVGSSENISLGYFDKQFTIVKVADSAIGSSPSVTYNIKWASTRNSSSPTSLFSSDRTVTSSAGTTTTTFGNNVVSAGSFMWFTTSATAGTISDFNATILYVD